MRWRRLRLLAALAPFAAAPLAAQAEEAKKGMPQLDFSDPLLLSQVVWLAIIFLALYLLLSRWALPQVAEVLDERARRIRTDLEAARAAQEEALAARRELEAATRNAHAEAQAAIAAAVARAKQEAFEQARALSAKIEAELAAAEARIEAAEAAARRALRGAVEETARALVEKLLGCAPREEVLNEVLARVLARAGGG